MSPVKKLLIGLLVSGVALGSISAEAQPLKFRWETRAFFGVENCDALPIDEATRLVCKTISGWIPQALPNDGFGHFELNGLPIPTHMVGPWRYEPAQFGPVVMKYGTNRFEAPFDRSLLRAGGNTIRFNYGDVLNRIANSYDFMFIDGDSRPLFSISKTPGAAYELLSLNLVTAGNPILQLPEPFRSWATVGHTSQSLGRELRPDNLFVTREVSLKELNPALALSSAILHDELRQWEEKLLTQSKQIASAKEPYRELDQLRTELKSLASGGTEAVTPEAVERILASKRSLPKEVSIALRAVADDLRRSIDEMRAEMERITREFTGQTAQVVHLIEQNLGERHFAPTHFQVTSHLGDLPEFLPPEVVVQKCFSKFCDSYAAAADKTIKELRRLSPRGRVTDRRAFLSTVRHWHEDQRALHATFEWRPAAQEEVGAFLRAQARVTEVLREHLDAQGWFNDNPVPIQVRALVDGTYAELLKDRPDAELKDALNTWQGPSLGPDREAIATTLVGIGRGIEFAADVLTDAADELERVRDLVVDMSKLTASIGAVFIPEAGVALAMVEVMTGISQIARGKTLTKEERVEIGLHLGMAAGGSGFWRGAKGALGGKFGHVADEIIKIQEKAAKAKRGVKVADTTLPFVKNISKTNGLTHSFDRHARQWFGGDVRADVHLKQWEELVQRTAKSKDIVKFTSAGEPTIGHLAKIDDKYFFVQFFSGAHKTGEMATAFVPSQAQLRAIFQLLKGQK